MNVIILKRDQQIEILLLLFGTHFEEYVVLLQTKRINMQSVRKYVCMCVCRNVCFNGTLFILVPNEIDLLIFF